MTEGIVRLLEQRCDELEAAVRYYVAKHDRAAIGCWFQLAEARGTRNVVRRFVELMERHADAA